MRYSKERESRHHVQKSGMILLQVLKNGLISFHACEILYCTFRMVGRFRAFHGPQDRIQRGRLEQVARSPEGQATGGTKKGEGGFGRKCGEIAAVKCDYHTKCGYTCGNRTSVAEKREDRTKSF